MRKTQISMNAKFVVTVFLSLATLSASAQSLTRYNVSGSSVDELISSMRANSPQGYWAHTRNFWKYNYKYLHTNGSFTLSEVVVSRTVEITMPHWTGYSSASNCLRQSWDAMYSSLKNHEDKHVSIADPVAAALKNAIEAVGSKSTASALEAAVDKAANAVFAQNRKAQALFDTSTNHGRTDPRDPVVLRACS